MSKLSTAEGEESRPRTLRPPNIITVSVLVKQETRQENNKQEEESESAEFDPDEPGNEWLSK